jgi:hypothetical protein
MTLDIAITTVRHWVNPLYLNQLQEAWHDEASAVAADDCDAVARLETAPHAPDAGDCEDSRRSSAVEPEARRSDGLALSVTA